MSNRFRTLLREVARFFLVAQAATWVSFVLFNVFVHGWFVGDPLLGNHAITSYVVANSVGMVISYHGARGWVFPDRPPQQADGGWTAYVVINLAAMALPVGCLVISRHVLGLEDALSDNLSANGIGLVLAFVARFYLFRRFVFQDPARVPSAASPAAGRSPHRCNR